VQELQLYICICQSYN